MVQLNPRTLAKLEETPAQAFPLTIQETTGEGRVMVLRGRSLPYRGVGWGSKLRVPTKYFPGNPVAQAQVLGPEWMPTEMNGMWKDAFLFNDDSHVTLLNFPKIATAGRPGSVGAGTIGGKSFASGGATPLGPAGARRARTVRDAMYLIQRGGQLLRVEWGSLVRYGFIEEFIPDHDREEDIRWSLAFKWIGDTASSPRPRLIPKIDPPGLLARILAAVQEFLRVIQAALAIARGSVAVVTQLITKVGSLVTGVLDTLNGFVDLVFVPAEMFGVLAQQLTSVILSVRDLIDNIRAVPQAYRAIKDGFNFNEVNITSEAMAAIAFNAAKLGVDAADTREELSRLSSPDLLGIFTTPEDLTLRDVSTQFYEGPDNWKKIADFNGLRGSIAPRGFVLRIPRLAGR